MKRLLLLLAVCALAACTPPPPSAPTPVTHDLGHLDCGWDGVGDDVTTAVSFPVHPNVDHRCYWGFFVDPLTVDTQPGDWVQVQFLNTVRTDGLRGLVCAGIDEIPHSERCVYLNDGDPAQTVASERLQSPGGTLHPFMQFWLDPNVPPLRFDDFFADWWYPGQSVSTDEQVVVG